MTTPPTDSPAARAPDGVDDRPMPPENWYHGVRQAGHVVVALVDRQGHQVRLVPHHVRHSPTGFEWGYNGSGPAELARCLLLDALDDPRCPGCGGTGRVLFDNGTDPDGAGEPGDRPFDPETDDKDSELVATCFDCHDDRLAALPYQEFKREFVARWTGDEWWIPRSVVRAWLTAHTAGP